ncbi:DUF1569 domain-containing protein [Myroides pelagicus]|uniref:DUF1569 domain-containing protein n=1 Tax=Myroides pelagicus TaxID=270914 RepID=A0A7K1GHE1_9FLAO|nr:DUF1569 domain-containing protein [Myroides pelagicus]MEC4113501.1 DUF1569 domain-containing protein [Myroides pelagicus]MTH28338.1 DUF1569 domain-containing protein [Myroides pelagicus]
MRTIQDNYNRFLEVYNQWEIALKMYSDDQICQPTSVDSWTIGQVYNHLIQSVTEFQAPAILACLNSKKDVFTNKNIKGVLVFKVLNKFPPAKIKVPASDDYTPKAPKSKKEVSEGMLQVLDLMSKLKDQIASTSSGKTPHPAFGYLNAEEWYQLIVMHWVHHLRQKKELDKVLFSNQ